jgi:hypothetical protein
MKNTHFFLWKFQNVQRYFLISKVPVHSVQKQVNCIFYTFFLVSFFSTFSSNSLIPNLSQKVSGIQKFCYLVHVQYITLSFLSYLVSRLILDLFCRY